jgi:hypothetical protein
MSSSVTTDDDSVAHRGTECKHLFDTARNTVRGMETALAVGAVIVGVLLTAIPVVTFILEISDRLRARRERARETEDMKVFLERWANELSLVVWAKPDEPRIEIYGEQDMRLWIERYNNRSAAEVHIGPPLVLPTPRPWDRPRLIFGVLVLLAGLALLVIGLVVLV